MFIKKSFILRKIESEYVIIYTGQDQSLFSGLLTVNEVEAEIWHLLQSNVTFEDLVKGILDEYDVDESSARADIQEFLDMLEEKGILVMEYNTDEFKERTN